MGGFGEGLCNNFGHNLSVAAQFRFFSGRLNSLITHTLTALLKVVSAFNINLNAI
jgi:hypothetical protein